MLRNSGFFETIYRQSKKSSGNFKKVLAFWRNIWYSLIAIDNKHSTGTSGGSIFPTCQGMRGLIRQNRHERDTG